MEGLEPALMTLRIRQQPEIGTVTDWETLPEETVRSTELWPHHWLSWIVSDVTLL